MNIHQTQYSESYYITKDGNKVFFSFNRIDFCMKNRYYHITVKELYNIKEIYLIDKFLNLKFSGNLMCQQDLNKLHTIKVINLSNVEIGLNLFNNILIETITVPKFINHIKIVHNVIINNFNDIKDTCTINYTL